jgi:hypothetical protein
VCVWKKERKREEREREREEKAVVNRKKANTIS